MAGGLAAPLDRLRDGLLDLLAHLEAGFDFADEDLPFIDRRELVGQLDDAAAERRRIARPDGRPRRRRRSAVRVVLVGRPNTGKSSLFNALLRTAAALVSRAAGHDPRLPDRRIDLDGVECQLIDTAGIEPRAAECDIRRAAHTATIAAMAAGRRAASVPRFHPAAGRLGARSKRPPATAGRSSF